MMVTAALLAGCGGPPLKQPPLQSPHSDARPEPTHVDDQGRPHFAVPPAPEIPADVERGHLLDNLHPELIERALTLYRRAQEAGAGVYFISGYRRFRPGSARARRGRASWHNFGLAFDLNLAHRRSMADALENREEDRDAWRAVGEIAAELGVTWGVDFGEKEIFHFEWHPGFRDGIRRPTLNTLLGYAGPDGAGYRAVWPLLDPAR